MLYSFMQSFYHSALSACCRPSRRRQRRHGCCGVSIRYRARSLSSRCDLPERRRNNTCQYPQLVLLLGASVDGGVLGNGGGGGSGLLLVTTRRGDGEADGGEDGAESTVCQIGFEIVGGDTASARPGIGFGVAKIGGAWVIRGTEDVREVAQRVRRARARLREAGPMPGSWCGALSHWRTRAVYTWRADDFKCARHLLRPAHLLHYHSFGHHLHPTRRGDPLSRLRRFSSSDSRLRLTGTRSARTVSILSLDSTRRPFRGRLGLTLMARPAMVYDIFGGVLEW
jgi:hypothetical protein